jgi:hypothetical protein
MAASLSASAARAAVTHHTLKARRAVTVYKPDVKDQPDLGSEAYTLNRVDVSGWYACLRSNDAVCREFKVALVHPPADPLPHWAGWLGVKRSLPMMVWGGGSLPPHNPGFLQSLDTGLLWKLLLGLLLLWALGFFHLPQNASVVDVLASRYMLATVVVLGMYLWSQCAGHARRLLADDSDVFRYFKYSLKPAPTGFKAGIASVTLGATVLRVMQGKASDVVHWLHPGPEVDGAHYRPRVCFRFQADGRTFEGCTTRQDWTAHPFIVPGDLLRMAVEPGSDGKLRVLALANLSDGHIVFDETDDRISTTSGSGAVAMPLLFFGLMALLIAWLGAGPQADALSAGLLVLCIGLAAWTGLATSARRQRRAALARVLGATLDEFDARSIGVEPLPMTYFD